MINFQEYSLEQWIQTFKELDLLGGERPQNFSLELATQEIYTSGLLHEIEQRFGASGMAQDGTWSVYLDQWPGIQDAAYHTSIAIKGWDPSAPEDRIQIRFSNFGRFVCLFLLDNKESTEEFRTWVQALLARYGYTFVPDDALYADWQNSYGNTTCAWMRFFEYL